MCHPLSLAFFTCLCERYVSGRQLDLNSDAWHWTAIVNRVQLSSTLLLSSTATSNLGCFQYPPGTLLTNHKSPAKRVTFTLMEGVDVFFSILHCFEFCFVLNNCIAVVLWLIISPHICLVCKFGVDQGHCEMKNCIHTCVWPLKNVWEKNIIKTFYTAKSWQEVWSGCDS